MVSVRSRVLKVCDDVTGMYTQATDSCTVGNEICPTPPTGMLDYVMVSLMVAPLGSCCVPRPVHPCP